MSKGKPTPGPWTATTDSRATIWMIDPMWIIVDGEADARLIAAAPTMYDYLVKRAAAGDDEAAQILGGINGSR